MPIYVTRPSIPDIEDYIKEIKPIFEDHILTNMGPVYKKFQSQLIQYLEGTAFLGSLEGGMFHKMCQSLLARQFMTRTGSDGIATIHHLLPGSRQVNDS